MDCFHDRMHTADPTNTDGYMKIRIFGKHNILNSLVKFVIIAQIYVLLYSFHALYRLLLHKYSCIAFPFGISA